MKHFFIRLILVFIYSFFCFLNTLYGYENSNLEYYLTNNENNYNFDIEVYGSDGCDDSDLKTVYLDLYKTKPDGEKIKFYSDTKEYYKDTIGCLDRGWLWGKSYTNHTCDFIDVTSNGNTFLLNYECNIYESRTRSAAGGNGWSRNFSKYGSFEVKNDVCNYIGGCINYNQNHIQPGESIIDWLSRINDNTSNRQINTKNTIGDPVNLNTGEFTYDNILMYNKSKGFPFEFGISYKNKINYKGTIGYNFDYSYNKYLVKQSDGNIYYYDGNFGVFKFIYNGTGFDYNTNINAELKIIEGKYSIIFNNTKTYIFNNNLKLDSINDIYGNTMIFSYDEKGYLNSIEDTNGRLYVLSYYDNYILKNITDFNGDKLEFNYFGIGEAGGNQFDLKNIKIKKGNSEKSISFTYTKSDIEKLSHNIIKLIDSENNIYVKNTYDELDRVLSQKYGNSHIKYNYITDDSGNIIKNSVIDRENNSIVYKYDSDGNTISKLIKKDGGDSLYRYEYNSHNYLVKEILPLGNGYTYKYDNNNNLIEKRQKADVNADDSNDDIVTKYIYDLFFNKPIQIIYPNGSIINFVLNINGNIIKKEVLGIEDIDGNHQNIFETYKYNELGELISKTDSNGNITNFEYSSGNIIKIIKGNGDNNIITNYSYDSNGNISDITDGEGNITNLSYNDFNMLKSLTTAENIKKKYLYNKLNKKINESIILDNLSAVNISYEYDILDNPLNITKDIDNYRQKVKVINYDNNSNITEIKDGSNATIKFSYNEEGYIKSKTILNGDKNITTNYIYDKNNKLIKQINPNSSSVLFNYDLYGRIIKQTLSNGLYTIYSYDKSGNILESKTYSKKGNLLKKESSTYDLLNRKISSTKYDIDNNTRITNKNYYDSVGNVIKIVDSEFNEINFIYDSFNRLIKIIDKLGNVTNYTYNKNNKLLSKNIIGTDGNNIKTSYTYDNDNRLISKKNNVGEIISYDYNNLNQITSKTSKNGIVTTYKYDYLGNLLEEITNSKKIKYEYDIHSNLVKLIDSNNNVTNYEYDNLNRLTKQIYPDNSTVNYKYDINSNVIQKIDPNGTIINYTYDNLNRLIQKDIILGKNVGGITKENYYYDSLSRLIKVTNNLGIKTLFTYDSMNRLTSETNNGKTIKYKYDYLGNMVMQKIDGRITSYNYDSSSRLLSITQDNKRLVEYNFSSLNLTKKIYGNGFFTNYTYDNLNRLKTLDNGIKKYSYIYNKNGNIINNGYDNYKYDKSNQLTKTTYSINNKNKYIIESFEYDRMGNRTKNTKNVESTSSLNINKNKNKFIKEKTVKYEVNELNQYINLKTKNKIQDIKYDKSGNIIKIDDIIYIYDYKNRLIKVKNQKKDTILVKFIYDSLGRRIKKITSDKTISYYYSGNNIVLEEIQKEKNLIKKYYTYSNILDDILFMQKIDNKKSNNGKNKVKNKYNGEIYYYHKNNLGSIVAITDSKGKKIQQYSYNIFGAVYLKQNPVGRKIIKDINFEFNNILYTGRRYDYEIGLYYNRARYYNPELGRFISRDPIDIMDDINLYRYVENNPITYVDLFGKSKKIAAEQFRIDFVNAYDEYLESMNKYYSAETKYKSSYSVPMIFGKNDYINKMKNKYNLALLNLEYKENIAKELHYNRNNFNLVGPEKIDDLNMSEWNELNILRSLYHQNITTILNPNKKIISIDGKNELIYNIDGVKVNDIEDIGTYNIYNPLNEKILHKKYDVEPYWRWGNGLNDGTTKAERIFGIGILY